MKILLKAPFPQLPPIVLPDGRTLPIEIRRSERARRLALRLSPATGDVELVLPKRMALATALDFLDSRRGWIIARARKIPVRIAFAEGAEIPILGVPHRLTGIGLGTGAAAPFTIADGRIEVTGRPEHLAARTRRGLIAHARHLLVARSTETAARIGGAVTRVTVGDAGSRWGSCAASGALRYSWRLVLAPERVLDYVVAHEVAHLRELNHSPRFWRLVAQLHPGWEDDRRWLKRHGAELHAYG